MGYVEDITYCMALVDLIFHNAQRLLSEIIATH